MIDKAKFYKFIYVSVSFSDKLNFAKTLKEKHPVEIPYLDMPHLNPVLREAIDSYFYIEDGPLFPDIYRTICRRHTKISFTVLGQIRGKDIFAFFSSCAKANISSFQVGDFVKVVEGSLKNLSANISAIMRDRIEISFKILNEVRKVSLKISQVVPQESYAGLTLNAFKSMEEKYLQKGIQRALILDGNNCLLRSMCNNPAKFNSKNQYVGGFIGFYFSLLKVKEMFPEYKIYVAFSDIKGDSLLSPELKGTYLQNLKWCKELVLHLGYTLCHSPTKETVSIIAHLIEKVLVEQEHVLLYSTDPLLPQLTSKKVEIFYPKTSFRGNSEFISEKMILEKTGLDKVSKYPWLLAFQGCLERNIPSVSDFFLVRSGPRLGRIRESEYLPLLLACETEEQFCQTVQQTPKFEAFHPSLLENLTRTKIAGAEEISSECKPFSTEEVHKILAEVEMYKEIELWDRTERICQGMW